MVLTMNDRKNPARYRRNALIGGIAGTVVAIAIIAGPFLRKQPASPPPLATTRANISAPVYLPAEFAAQDELLLGGFQLAELFPAVLVSIIDAVADNIQIRILAGSPTERTKIESVLAGAGLAAAPVKFTELPIMTMWVRDFGPLTVAEGNGQRQMRGFHYRERRGNNIDDGVPGHLAQEMNWPLISSPVLLEGGDFVSNGLGLGLLSTRVVNRNAHYLDRAPDETIRDIAAHLGFENVSLLPALQGESTGHADMFCAFLKADLVVVGQYEAAIDSVNAAQLNNIATTLATLPTRAGPLQVVRMPMPNHDDGIWRTYTNIVFANDVLLVPVYPDYCPDLDEVALATYRRLLPHLRVVGIDASQLIRMNGALHCITMNVPSAIPVHTQ